MPGDGMGDAGRSRRGDKDDRPSSSLALAAGLSHVLGGCAPRMTRPGVPRAR
jgi:hypothetical protein